jgi:hypothetical protein
MGVARVERLRSPAFANSACGREHKRSGAKDRTNDLHNNAGFSRGNIMDAIEALTVTPMLALPDHWRVAS